jgi:CheY-like chemotaxis protein
MSADEKKRESKGHRVLVVEDDPEARKDIGELLASRGDDVRFAETVNEALAAIEEEEFCYFVIDQQLPTRPGDKPLVGGGERVLGECRKKDERRDGRGRHVTPIVVCTGYSEHHEFVSRMYDAGADAFFAKPVVERAFLDKVRGTLEKVGRETHEKCAGLSAQAVPTVGAVPVAPTLTSTAAERMTEDGDEADPIVAAQCGGIAAQLAASQFADVRIKVIDGHTVLIAHKRKRLRATYIDLGLATKTRVPMKEWGLLLDVCAGHGKFRWKNYGGMVNAKQRVSVLQAKLREAFGLEDNPFHKFRVMDGWRAKFFATSEIGEEER